jgi:hypothetical protein
MIPRRALSRRPTLLPWRGALLCVALAAMGCRNRRPEPVLPACEPVSGTLPGDAMAVALAGEYHLRLFTADPPRSAYGVLSLRPTPDSLRFARTIEGRMDSTVAHPLYGTTDADLGAVGAMLAGDGTTADPTHPGVLVVQWWTPSASGGERSTDIVLRIGSEGNRVGTALIDVAYLVLRVGRIDADGFAGRWESGVEGRTTAGRFCADRRAP